MTPTPLRWLSMTLTTLLLITSLANAADIPDPQGDRLVKKNARLELLFTRSAKIEGGLTEGPAVAPDGSIYFSDIPFGEDHGMIHRFDPRTNTTKVFSNNSGKSNGLIFNSKGRLLACEGAGFGGRQISSTDTKTGKKTTLVNSYSGKRLNAPNDLCVDATGRIYFSDPRYVGHEKRELKHRAVYCIEPDGSLFEVTHNISKPNGIAISPDGKMLFVADHDNGTDNIDPDAKVPPTPGDMKIYGWWLKDNGRVESQRFTIVDFNHYAMKGCDGMTVDENGFLYLTVRDAARPGVMVIDPTQGKNIGYIPTGPIGQQQATAVGLPSNVEFGIGKDRNLLYITVDTSLYRIRLKTQGWHVQYQGRRK